MNLTQSLSNFFLLLYRNFNRSGVLDREWTQDLFVSSYFTYKKYLEDSTAKLIKNYPSLFQSGHILDIGANIGYTSFVFSKALTPPYKIFAFEPEKRNLKFLKKVAQKYLFSDKLVLTAAAVGNQEGEIELWQNDDHHADHRIITDEFRKQLTGSFQTQKTPLITIDKFLKDHQASTPISFIKIDVQGYELAVCQGMIETLAANPQCLVEFEYCPSMMEALGYAAEELLQFFQDRGYFFYSINKKGLLEPLTVGVDKRLNLKNNFRGYFDIICSKQDRISWKSS